MGLNELREGKAEDVWNMLLKEGWGRRRKKRSGGIFSH